MLFRSPGDENIAGLDIVVNDVAAVGGSGGLSFVSDVKIVSINKKRILQTVKMRSGKILFLRLVVIRLRDGR